MTWRDLFERASAYDVDRAAIRATLDRHREEDDADA